MTTGLDAFKLKVLAMGLMLLDHIYYFIPGTPIWFTWLGRTVAPIFLFFVVEGFYHTRSRLRYTLRMFMWAGIMFAGTRVIMHRFPPVHTPIVNNIFLSLALSLCLMSVIEWTRATGNRGLGVPAAIAVGFLSLFSEASLYGIGLTLVFYLFRGERRRMSVAYVLVSLAMWLPLSLPPVGPGISLEQLLYRNYQWMMVFSIPFILMYNGQRGPKNNFTKYLFYAFYPAHVWALYLIGRAIALGGWR
ncbi:MAG TPA: conjugal transfer protein TraX [Firmicutes bacterium]|nr:conjugal transfer protein TraX [Bacillota bacterium]